METGFRSFKVVRKVSESDVITSFYLEPVDGAAVSPCKPGQYLTLRIPSPEGTSLLKTYSVSGDSACSTGYRITVKREDAPPHAPDAPPGVGSNYLHDQVDVGSILEIAPPRGDFYLNEDSSRPVLLLSGGVGLTPLVSMLHRLAQTDRRVYFLHACENGSVHALREEVVALSTEHADRITAHFIYREPTAADLQVNHHHAAGFITKELLQSLLPLDDYEVYFCGPAPFMKAMYDVTRTLGIAEDRIAYEFFGPAKSLKEAPIKDQVPATPPPSAAKTDGIEVVFQKSGITGTWQEESGSLLEFAEAMGLNPDFSCRSGICGTCLCTLVEGKVEYIEEPLEDVEDGSVLICCSQPKGRVVLDI